MTTSIEEFKQKKAAEAWRTLLLAAQTAATDEVFEEAVTLFLHEMAILQGMDWTGDPANDDAAAFGIAEALRDFYLSMDLDDPNLLAFEKFVKRLFAAAPGSGSAFLRKHVEAATAKSSYDGKQAISAMNRRNRKLKPPSVLNQVIADALKKNPCMTGRDVLKYLKSQVGRGRISFVDGDVIECAGGETFAVTGLSSRISYVRKNYLQ